MVKKVILYIFSVVLCISCGKHEYPTDLVEADSLCYSNPKLALEKIVKIGINLDSTKTADWMYCRLVKLKAQDRAYILHSDLENINQLIAYYEDKGEERLLPEIYYLAGSTYFDLHDSPQALDYYHKVLDHITAKDNLRLWGITHAQIGYVMLYQGNYVPAVEHFKESYLVDSLRHDTEGMIYDLRDLGYSYSSAGKLDSAIIYSHQALQLSLKIKNSQMANNARSSLVGIYLEPRIHNVDSVAKYIHPMLCNVKPEDRSGVYCVAMKYYKLRNMPDSMNYYIKKIEQYGEIYAKYSAWRLKIETALEKNGNYKDLQIWNQFMNYSDSVDKIGSSAFLVGRPMIYRLLRFRRAYLKGASQSIRHPYNHSLFF